ncbi:MAG: ATP-dependent RecD-like DNA helicase [Thermodesulfovibrio sp.]|nr:ATP-dependent RecD-like DNA helicase [Thermodesulfovibrio sp.]
MLVELQGQLERITYHNEENHYIIARLKVRGQRNLVTIVGNVVSVSPGEMLNLKGSWDMHPKYGEQFKISSYETVVPATVKGIERYLGSGLIKGIGPVMAKRLVEKFGEETLDIIEKSTERLQEVEGIGAKRIGMIKTAWDEQKEVRNVMVFLQNHEVSSAYAAKIYKQYGRESISVVRENPYRLASDIFGIGFLTADKIAQKLGIPRDSQIRAEEGILYVLQKLADEGHVYYPETELIDEAMKILEIDETIVRAALLSVTGDKKVVLEKERAYLVRFYVSETGIAEQLRSVLTIPKSHSLLDQAAPFDLVEKELRITLAERQREAVQAAVSQKVLVVTGGPGTGKTTIIRAIIGLYRKSGQSVLLAAPTGRAAKRMSEASGFEAKTIHRLLEFSPTKGGFKRNEDSPLEADLIIIDEASMIDTQLMYHFLKAIPLRATLVLVGDIDQLPSVGAGNVLKDIIDSGAVPTITLNEIFRQSSRSLIVVNAHKINHGEFPYINSERETSQDFYFFQCEEPSEACSMIVDMCIKRIPDKFGYHPVNDIQVLSPMHRGIIGAANLNAELQKHLNKSTVEVIRAGRSLKTGDKVMQIRNNYDKDVFNGDIGRITSLDLEEQSLLVNFDGRQVAYDFIELDEIVLAYAISVHKSQGSEYPVVILPVLTQHYMMLQRNLLYTAITRGKKLVVVIGTKKALAIAIKNNKQQLRYTGLKERLQTASER